MARTFEVPDDEDAQLWFKGYNLLTACLLYTSSLVRHPNVGIVSVPDERIVKLGELYHTKKRCV